MQRQPIGYRLTGFGQEMLPFAQAAGVIRMTCPEPIEELAGHARVGFDDTMAWHRIAQWLRQVAPDVPLVARSNSVLGLVPELTRIWRLLTTRELRRTPRVSAFFDFIVEEIETLRPIIAG